MSSQVSEPTGTQTSRRRSPSTRTSTASRTCALQLPSWTSDRSQNARRSRSENHHLCYQFATGTPDPKS